ncbi:MAG: c-type cytochrome domain-containing protein, partial [Rubripirellula sp.]
MIRFLIQRCTLLAIAMAAHSAIADGNQDRVNQDQGFLQTYCLNCHGENKKKSDVQLDQLRLPVNDKNHELWAEVVQNIQRGDMPPKDTEQPSDIKRQLFLANIIAELEKHSEESSATSDALLRLTNNQIAHSIQDLLQTHEHIADQL